MMLKMTGNTFFFKEKEFNEKSIYFCMSKLKLVMINVPKCGNLILIYFFDENARQKGIRTFHTTNIYRKIKKFFKTELSTQSLP